nr:acyl carrier protein [Actinomadura rubrisoli]
MAEVLGLPRPDALDAAESFVEAGGDSLQAMRLASRLRDAGYHVGVRDILLAGGIPELARSLRPIDEREDHAGAERPGAGTTPRPVRTRRLTPEQEVPLAAGAGQPVLQLSGRAAHRRAGRVGTAGPSVVDVARREPEPHGADRRRRR